MRDQRSQLMKDRMQNNPEAQKKYIAELEERIRVLKEAGCVNMVAPQEKELRWFLKEYPQA